jgi:membrane protein implicated in regulation of membrane protease activity
MGWIILILVLVAAAFGVLGAVLKTFLVIMLAFLMFAIVLVMLGWWFLKKEARKMSAQMDRSFGGQPPYGGPNPGGGELPGHDDRY